MTTLERYRGCLLGLATGDAVGTNLEFETPGTFTPLTDMIGGGPFDLQAGQWTDDTSLALCIAESLIEKKNFDATDQMQRYLRWYRDGHLSSTGRCFDIGSTTRQSLEHFAATGNAFAGRTDEFSAGNGSLMRLAPVPMFYAVSPSDAIEMSGDSSRTTHGAKNAVDACRYFGGLIVGALNEATKAELLSPRYLPVGISWDRQSLAPEINVIANGSFKTKNPPEIKGTGYVVNCLEAALWAFYHSNSFEEGCLLAVNLGDDADTTGAVYGQLAGAFYGEQDIPEKWRRKLSYRSLIETFAGKLFYLSQEQLPK
ncbi:MAG: ADP-ribosylglycohydrolase family protein [Rhizobacter sp.]|nr:ADP-ribosylglycohydrolase family protein [Chlorobiales bacterium]